MDYAQRQLSQAQSARSGNTELLKLRVFPSRNRDALTAPIALHARNDHRSAWAVFLLIMGVADPHRIWTRIARTAIDRNASRRAANDPAALRGKLFGGQPVCGRCNRRRLGLRCGRRRHHDQASEEANENCRNPHHDAPSRALVPLDGRQRLRLTRARQQARIPQKRHRFCGQKTRKLTL